MTADRKVASARRESEDELADAPTEQVLTGLDSGDVLEITTGDFVVAEVESPSPRPPRTPQLSGPSRSEARSAVAERERLLTRVREKPLEPAGYHLLAAHFARHRDSARSSLMAEIGAALEGTPSPVPAGPPKLILSATDRAGLRHPALRGEEGELLALTGTALCRAQAERARSSRSLDEFGLEAGRGARAAAEALLAAVRILGLRAPDVFVSEDNGPPFSLEYGPEGPRLWVGRLAVKRPLPEEELRFFAGRALFTQNPELLALRTLRKEQLARGLNLVTAVLRGAAEPSPEVEAMDGALPAKARPRIHELLCRAGGKLSWTELAEGARHSANRAGLVVAGSVAPALNALKAKRALASEVTALLRFAASERYLRLRRRMAR